MREVHHCRNLRRRTKVVEEDLDEMNWRHFDLEA